MTQTSNIPIQMIYVCSTLGDLSPLRFRFESEEHQLITVDVSDVLARKETHLNGIYEILYTCRTVMDDSEILFVLKYNVASHKWLLLQRL